MLKLTGKLLVITLVIAAFAAGIYYLVQGSSLNNGRVFAERDFDSQGAAGLPNPGAPQFQGRRPPEGFREGGEDGEGGFSLFRGLAGLTGHGLQIALITLLVLFIRRLILERNGGRRVVPPVSG